MALCVGLAVPASAEPLAWHADALVAWYPDKQTNGGHVVAALRGGYYHGVGHLIVGVEGYAGYGFPISDETASTPLEIEPRIGLRFSRVRERDLTFEQWGTVKGSCSSTVSGGYLVSRCLQELKDRTSYRTRNQKEYAVLLGLRTQPDGRMAGTLAYRWQLARRYEEKLSGDSPVPSPISFVFDAGASAVLRTTDDFEPVSATSGVAGYFDISVMFGAGVAWTIGTRLGLTGFRYVESEEPEYVVWLYLGRGGMAGR
jgi:hypothetical protein